MQTYPKNEDPEQSVMEFDREFLFVYGKLKNPLQNSTNVLI